MGIPQYAALFAVSLLVLGCQAAVTTPTPASTAVATPRPATSATVAASPSPFASAAPAPTPTTGIAPSPVAKVPGTVQPGAAGTGVSMQVPSEVAQAVRTEVARRTGVDPVTVRIVRAEQVDWPDASLGCPQPGMAYAQVVTPGYRVVVEAGGRTLNVHTSTRGTAVVCN